MERIWATAAIAIAITITTLFLLHHRRRRQCLRRRLPPGPRALPIIGHFHLLGKLPHQDLRRLAAAHGPIMYTRLGAVDTVVVSSPAAAELFLKTHDLAFANRPHNEAAFHLGYEQRNLVFGRYGPYWRSMRKLCTLELLSAARLARFAPMRAAEVGLLVDSLKEQTTSRTKQPHNDIPGSAPDQAAVVDLSARIAALSADTTCLMVFGRKFAASDFDERGFKAVMTETMVLGSSVTVGDYFPYLRWIGGSVGRLKRLGRVYDAFLERIIDDHAGRKGERGHDFVDTLVGILESGDAGFEFDRRNVKSILLDMLLAGVDTSAAAAEWAMADLMKHPEEMRKLQKDLEEVVGPNRMVEESDLTRLKYLDCVIKESMRLHPVGPLLIHEAMEDCEVAGFHIPNKTRILVNVWAIGRDPEAWTDPEKFIPGRFLGSNVDLRGRDFQLIPFGSGRRSCPGFQLGLTMVRLIVAQLVHCFNWELPHGVDEVDMSEKFGLVTSKAKHLMAIPTYKLND